MAETRGQIQKVPPERLGQIKLEYARSERRKKLKILNNERALLLNNLYTSASEQGSNSNYNVKKTRQNMYRTAQSSAMNSMTVMSPNSAKSPGSNFKARSPSLKSAGTFGEGRGSMPKSAMIQQEMQKLERVKAK